jgi:indole-3-glycerol phosphate synthase/phosphoribosylanthranilate isomerase
MPRLRDALGRQGLAAIAEIKRRSPSAGDLRPAADPALLAHEFERAGAAAVSVLVDERFAGTLADLKAARAAAALPLLAKGFFAAEDDVRAVREAGADAVLLLVRDLDDDRLRRLMRLAADLEMDALVEAHDAVELERALAAGADPIGINARDLGTFAVDRSAQLALVAQAPRDRVVVAESGIASRAQAAAAELAGADAVLVGSALMRAPDPAAKLGELLSRPLVKVCGLTRQEDVDAAVDAGADFCGFIFADTPRRAPRVLDVPDDVLSVAVYVGKAGEEDADLVQVYERERGKVRGREAVLLRDGQAVARVVDLPWEEADPHHLRRAAAAEGRVVLAGRLGPDNVREAVERVRPWAVDAASRLEREPGIKDHEKVRAFVRAARC